MRVCTWSVHPFEYVSGTDIDADAVCYAYVKVYSCNFTVCPQQCRFLNWSKYIVPFMLFNYLSLSYEVGIYSRYNKYTYLVEIMKFFKL